MDHNPFHSNGNADSNYNSNNNQNQDAQKAKTMVLHSRVPMPSSFYQPSQHQLSTGNGGGGGTAVIHAQVGPRADTISNRTSSLASSSLVPITNPGMTMSNRVNYQYDPVPTTEDYDTPDISLGLQQHLTYMQPSYTRNLASSNTPKYNGRPMDNAMAILSSEQYDDPSASRRSVRRQQEPIISLFGLVEQKEEVPVRKTNQARQSHDVENSAGERRRKKQKVSSEDEGEDDAAKKARGRPRLDTKDETAADVSYIYFL